MEDGGGVADMKRVGRCKNNPGHSAQPALRIDRQKDKMSSIKVDDAHKSWIFGSQRPWGR